jgi:hypothetical protein
MEVVSRKKLTFETKNRDGHNLNIDSQVEAAFETRSRNSGRPMSLSNRCTSEQVCNINDVCEPGFALRFTTKVPRNGLAPHEAALETVTVHNDTGEDKLRMRISKASADRAGIVVVAVNPGKARLRALGADHSTANIRTAAARSGC